MKFREGTGDENIFNCINKHNEYNLPDRLSGDDIIVDIGCHIGSFSYACLARGAGKVFAYEAWYENYCMANFNLMEFGDRFHLENRAVWKCGTKDLTFIEAGDKYNTGGGNVWSVTDGLPVSTVTLDEILDPLPYISILKLDCEGSEFPILFASTKLDKVKAITGEYHEFEGEYDKNKIPPYMKMGDLKFTIDGLKDYLEPLGFTVSSKRSEHEGKPTNIGLFTAIRE